MRRRDFIKGIVGPRAHQDRVGTVLAAFGVADRQSVNRDCLRVNHGAHGHGGEQLAGLPVVVGQARLGLPSRQKTRGELLKEVSVPIWLWNRF